MSNYRRIRITGSTYFFTVNVANRKHINLTYPMFRQTLREGIIKVRQTLPFKMDACVLMPDHIHCLWTLPPNDANFSARWAIIKRHVSRCCGESYNGYLSASRQKRHESAIWQRRFWEHWIRDEIDFERHIDYIHYNPVKHGYVKQALDWPYSTFHRDVKAGIYPVYWGGTYFGSKNFGE